MIVTSSHLFIANDFAMRAVASELRSRSGAAGPHPARPAHTAECPPSAAAGTVGRPHSIWVPALCTEAGSVHA